MTRKLSLSIAALSVSIAFVVRTLAQQPSTSPSNTAAAAENAQLKARTKELESAMVELDHKLQVERHKNLTITPGEEMPPGTVRRDYNGSYFYVVPCEGRDVN